MVTLSRLPSSLLAEKPHFEAGHFSGQLEAIRPGTARMESPVRLAIVQIAFKPDGRVAKKSTLGGGRAMRPLLFSSSRTQDRSN